MRFDWDDANREHIAEHAVTTDEVEYVFLHDPLDVEVQLLDGEERLIQVGATLRGRILTVISVEREAAVRFVTAYDASRKDRAVFERWRAQNYGTEA